MVGAGFDDTGRERDPGPRGRERLVLIIWSSAKTMVAALEKTALVKSSG